MQQILNQGGRNNTNLTVDKNTYLFFHGFNLIITWQLAVLKSTTNKNTRERALTQNMERFRGHVGRKWI